MNRRLQQPHGGVTLTDDDEYWKKLSLNALHEKLNYWNSIAWDWTNTPTHYSHKMVAKIAEEIRSRGIKVDIKSRRET